MTNAPVKKVPIHLQSSQNRLLIKNGRVVNDDGMEDADVYIEDGVINCQEHTSKKNTCVVNSNITKKMLPGPVSTAVPASLVATVAIPGQFQSSVTTQKSPDNMKMKCKTFFVNLLDLCNKEPPSVKIGVKKLVQDLIDDKIMPEVFCFRLERVLDATPQPAIIGFLRESLPLLRRSLYSKELSIEGINPPTSITLPTPALRAVEAKLSYVIIQKFPAKATSNSTTPMLQSIYSHGKTKETMDAKTVAVNSKLFIKPTATVPFETYAASKAECSQTLTDSKMEGLDDINDVPAMGGVNLAEETQNILNSTDMFGTPNRSCTDEYFIPRTLMLFRIKAVTAKREFDTPSVEVADIISHAVHDRFKNVLEKLVAIARHRMDSSLKRDDRYEITQNVGSQLKFLQEVDMGMVKKKENMEKEYLLKLCKARARKDDAEYSELRAKAIEKHRAELEEIRLREANMTALQALGPKKRRIEDPGEGCSSSVNNVSGSISAIGSNLSLTPRVTRVTLQDMIFLLEQEKKSAHSHILFLSYLK